MRGQLAAAIDLRLDGCEKFGAEVRHAPGGIWYLAATLWRPGGYLTPGMTPHKIAMAFTSGRYGPPPLTAEESLACWKNSPATRLEHPNMPDAVKYEVPDWIYPACCGPVRRCSLQAEMTALAEPAPLDLRVNALKSTREECHRPPLAAETSPASRAHPYSPWGLRLKPPANP